jgi:uncharacterized lipoprotein
MMKTMQAVLGVMLAATLMAGCGSSETSQPQTDGGGAGRPNRARPAVDRRRVTPCA